VSAIYLVTYLTFLQAAEETLGRSYRLVSDGHADDADVRYMTDRFARRCAAHAEALGPVIARSERSMEPEPERLHVPGLSAHRAGPLGLLRDLQDLYQLANLIDITWVLVGQAGQGARDRGLLQIVDGCAEETRAQLAWLRMRMKAAAPQTLLVAAPR
jgi:hypothetical protein